jgi:urea transport system permease protein
LLSLALVLSHFIFKSRFGKVIIAIRDGESRARFIGYRAERYKVWLFVYSAVIAGIAGALYVPQVGIINPGEFSPVNSIEIVIWVAVGGRATLIGAVLGALLVNYAKTRFTAIMPEAWLFALGALFVLVTLYLPNGLMGLKAQLIDRKTKRAQLKASSLSVPSDSQEKVI